MMLFFWLTFKYMEGKTYPVAVGRERRTHREESNFSILAGLITASKSVYVELPSRREFAEPQISQNQRLLFNQVKVNLKKKKSIRKNFKYKLGLINQLRAFFILKRSLKSSSFYKSTLLLFRTFQDFQTFECHLVCIYTQQARYCF